MSHSASTMRFTKAASGRIIFSGLIWLSLIGSGSAAPAPSPRPAAKQANTAIGTAENPNPDALLIDVYKDLRANRLRQAQAKADRLVEAYPDFRLGHLIRGDLLLMHTRRVTGFGVASKASADKLNDLRDEAIVRIKSIRGRPDPDLIPRAIIQMRDDQKYALVVDATQSRLYLYHHLNGHLTIVADYYVSQGKLGINKLKEGDQRTPVGIYYITSRLPREKLPAFYGSGALPINYPNEWDKLNGRSGSGIWLHGTPNGNYSRPPLASDGCVVLTNPDLEKLSLSVDIGKTPVMISERVEFINKKKADIDRAIANKMVESWRRDTESKNTTRLLSHYSKKFKSSLGENLNIWFTKSRPSLAAMQDLSVRLKDITLFRYPGANEMIVGTFTQDNLSSKGKSTFRTRQYWIKEHAGWKIIYETNI
jgi:murein L,D-transpeptidase YafK